MNKKAIDFIIQISEDVVKVCSDTKLFPSLMVAQACLESNYGQSKLSVLHHNFFGIKANASWKGEVVYYNTTEYINKTKITIKQSFRKYLTREAGFVDRVKFLQINPRYAKNGVFVSNNPQEQAQAFARAGYATDPLYATKLINIIYQYNLIKYDLLCKTPSNISTTTSTTSRK
ncbi:glucosaminidase domain-containing protein [Mucilaginibacter sp. PAMB04274]|uniref:glycoside hydrolase family 73 protein n=1 Tax=Mucilaginibacter sp. PAMB04274 TaxID=3138568 RepID=UPI0031F6E286